MENLIRYRWCVASLALVLFTGCGTAYSGAKDKEEPKERDQKKVADHLLLEREDGKPKRVIIEAEVCWGADRQGMNLFEQLLTKPDKVHEAILVTEVDASKVHASLLAVGAKPGSTAVFEEKFQPAKGTRIKVSLRYKKKAKGEKEAKEVEVSAQSWIRYVKTEKQLDKDWVFAGSKEIRTPEGKMIYLANRGNMICVCTMYDAMLDLPIENLQGAENLLEPVVDNIPEKGTAVQVVLEPILEK